MYKRTVFVSGGQQAVAEMLFMFSHANFRDPGTRKQIVGPREDDRINSRMIKFSEKIMKNNFKEYEFR